VNCPEFVELVSAFLDGVLEPVHEVLFVEHLSSCSNCAVCLAQFRMTVRVLAQAPCPATITVKRREQLVAAFRAARG